MHWAGVLHLVFFGILIPLLVLQAHFRIRSGAKALPDPARHFRKTAFELAMLATMSVLVARLTWIDLLAFDAGKLVPGLAAGAFLYLFAVLYMRPRWRKAVESRAPIVRLFMPRNAAERGWWIAVSVLAGVGEEITWRGVQTQLLHSVVGSLALAGLLSALSFGAAHFVQGWRSAATIVVFAIGFQLVVWASGSLFVAMLVHIAYDVTAGLAYGRLGRELGYKSAVAAARPDG